MLMPKIVALPTAVPTGNALTQRNNELGVLLAAIAALSDPWHPNAFPPAGVRTLNVLAERLQGELDRMLANAMRAGDLARECNQRSRD